MFKILITTFLSTFLFVNIDSIPNTTSELISTYAKVAHWGSTNSKTPNEARSRGQSLWTQSTNAKISERQKKRPTYYYSPGKSPTSKLDQTNQNPIPSKGEVQERFNPRPYFDFTFDDYPYKKPDKPKSPTIVYGTPVNSKPSTDSYSSPFNSYNPPNFKPDETLPTLTFPPSNNSFPPPIQPPLNFPDNFHPPLSPPQVQVDDMPTDEPTEDKPKDEGPPQDTEETFLDHPPPDFYHHHHHPPKPTSMEEQDLPPPPPPYAKFPPQYFDHKPEDYYHYNPHHVYHEVKTTPAPTTTIKPRAGHYSYYYLGRKLWYIPLYFSVYFIIYVTILILKSIARHKIQFTHNFDKGRSLTDGYVDPKIIDSVENVNKQYM